MKTIIAALIITVSNPVWAVRSEPASKPVIVKKVKLFRSHPFRFMSIRFAHTDPLVTVDDEDVITQRRYRWEPDQAMDVDIPDHAKFRLWLARQLAMKMYSQRWENT